MKFHLSAVFGISALRLLHLSLLLGRNYIWV